MAVIRITIYKLTLIRLLANLPELGLKFLDGWPIEIVYQNFQSISFGHRIHCYWHPPQQIHWKRYIAKIKGLLKI